MQVVRHDDVATDQPGVGSDPGFTKEFVRALVRKPGPPAISANSQKDDRGRLGGQEDTVRRTLSLWKRIYIVHDPLSRRRLAGTLARRWSYGGLAEAGRASVPASRLRDKCNAKSRIFAILSCGG